MAKVINPTDSALSIVYKGVTYSVDAGGVNSDVPAEVAIHWKENIHAFISIDVEADAPAPVKEVVEIPEEIIVSREEVVAEVGEEAVAAIEAEAEVSEAEVVIVPSTKKRKK